MKIDCAIYSTGFKKDDRYKIISILFLLFFFSMVVTYGQEKKSTTYKEKKLISAPVLISGEKLKTYAISGKVTQVFAYCGGAAPSEEMLERLAKPVAYAGKKFFIRLGKINRVNAKIIKSFTTGKNGEFSFRLAPGTYSIILEEQFNLIKVGDVANEFMQVDEKCLEEWWSKPFYLLKVKNKNISELNFNFHHQCFISFDIPCITYVGPQPL